ncbi:MAG: hypothetical protein KDD94_09795 [Calditrichaeota bacterium]|nr:hypothetical protein [Calditrichota bacterium]
MTNYLIEETADGSRTLYNSDFEEQYHSKAGAWQEAQIKYYDACRIEELALNNTHIAIFELGFGLGYNLIPFLNFFQNHPNKHIRYISCEFDTSLFSELYRLRHSLYPLEYVGFFEILLKEKVFDDEWLTIEIIEKDVRNAVLSLKTDSIDAIYHDPFSPYKNTECWTKNLFDQYYRIMKNHAILSTYSMSTPVRSGIFQAGFFVYEGVGDQSKQSGTLAAKTATDLPKLDQKSTAKLHESPERIPFIDPDLNLDRMQIKSERLIKKERGDYSDIIRKPLV